MRIQWQLTQQRYAVLFSHPGAAASTKYVLSVTAVRTNVDAHVLDDAQHGHVDLLEHLETLARVGEGDVLRRCHDHSARHGDTLCESQLYVPRTGGHVDDQVVERAPVGFGQELRQCLRDHGTTPDHG